MRAAVSRSSANSSRAAGHCLEVVADRLLLVAVELAQTVGQQVGVVVLTGPGHSWFPSAGGFIAARRARSAW